jgi:DUF1365 family protein
MDARSCLYVGEVMHRRARPAHKLRYRVFSLLLDLDELPALDRRLRWFSYNRFNFLSFHDRDHGRCDGTSPRAWIEDALAAHGLPTGGRIALLCFPRLFGYVFNPLSVFFCYAPAGGLAAILYEVRNTFGDKHGYLIALPADHEGSAPIRHACAKDFYVSPFLPIAGEYRFQLKEPTERLSLQIRHMLDGDEALLATHTAAREALTDESIRRNLIRHKLMTVKVMMGIHWEALLLWLKGARFHSHPPPPATDITFVRASGSDLSNAA